MGCLTRVGDYSTAGRRVTRRRRRDARAIQGLSASALPRIRTPVAGPRIGVIAAAGRGRRIHPRSVRVPKVMLEVAGKPLLVRNIELLRDALGVREIVLVVSHLHELIRE